MNRFLITLLTAIICSAAQAQLSSDGFYRIQNVASGRYAYVVDDKGHFNVSTTSADLLAVKLYLGEEKAMTDPASVLYIKKNGSQYDLVAQGTSLYTIIGIYLNIRDNKDNTYWAYGTYSGVTRYLYDGVHDNYTESSSLIDGGDELKWRYWYIKPITDSDNSYFGIKPEIELNDKYYQPFFAAFPYSKSNASNKIWYVTKIESHLGKAFAIVKEYTGNVVPEGSALIFECASAKPVDNKLTLGGTATESLSGNMLKGVYFDNKQKTHFNRTEYTPATMRVLGIGTDGKLGFVTASGLDYLPANKAYLTVPEGTPAELTVATQEEFEEYQRTHDGVNTILQDSNSTFDVYNTLGVKVLKSATTLEGLPKGIYIVNGKKHIVK